VSAEGQPPTEGDTDSERNGDDKRQSEVSFRQRSEIGEAVARHLVPDLDRMVKDAGQGLTRIRISTSPSEQVMARILDTSNVREGLRRLMAPVTQQRLVTTVDITSLMPNYQALLRNLR